jgi:hypothetical protein
MDDCSGNSSDNCSNSCCGCKDGRDGINGINIVPTEACASIVFTKISG